MSAVFAAPIGRREIVLRTRGQRHGPITRLVSPSDIGELIKPFVFLDFFDIPATDAPGFGWHPHSGIATLTVIHQGAVEYQETTGARGVLSAGGVEWMRAGGGVWHTGKTASTERTQGLQLWIALPEKIENGPSQSQYLAPQEVPSEGPARVILGSHGDATSAILAPERLNYLDVRLAAGQQWIYQSPHEHEIAWLAVAKGTLRTPEPVSAGELVVFEESNNALAIYADSAARFVLGSAAKHPHELVLGHYSVHTSEAALIAGESEIRRIGHRLAAAGTFTRV
jgi:redox-sensitive bicupin YhaK (pirin superfamily)